MPRLAELYVATRTRNVNDAGTSDAPILVVTRGGRDLFQVPLDTHMDGLGTGKAALFKINVAGQALDSEDLALRLVASGNDAWAPEHIIAWGETVTNQVEGRQVVPLGALIDLATPLTAATGGTWLSADDSEGVITLPLTSVGWGSLQTRASRIIVVVGTAQIIGFPIAGPGPGGPYSTATGTDSDVTLQAGAPGRQLLHYRFPQTPQDDLEKSAANFYMTSVPGPFSRGDIEGGSFVLSIAGEDWWVPVYVAVFGLDTATGQPTSLIPFVHAPTTALMQMSTNPAKGWESNPLPNARVPSTLPSEFVAVRAALARTVNENQRPGPNVPIVRIQESQKTDKE